MVLKYFINITYVSDQFVLYYYKWSESFYTVNHLKTGVMCNWAQN